MEKKKKIRIAIFLFIITAVAISYFATRKPLKEIEKCFSEIHGDKNAFAYEHDFYKIRFEDNTIDFKNKVLDGDFCGGVALSKDKLFFTTIKFDNDNYIFKIIESDYDINNQKTIYEKRVNYEIEAFSYDKIIYFSAHKNGNKIIDVEAFNINSNKYLGIVSQVIGVDCYDYISLKEINNPFKWEAGHFFSNTYIDITKKRTQETKSIEKEKLLDDNVGKKIVEQKDYFWSSAQWIDGKLYLICSIISKEYTLLCSYFNVVYEYDFENDNLYYRFHFISDDYTDLYLYFGDE